MPTTSNPVIRNLLVATSSAPPPRKARVNRRMAQLRPAASAERPLSVDDIVVSTGLSFAVVVASAFLTALLELHALALPAVAVGIGLTVSSVIRPKPIRAVTLGYSLAEGIVLGSVSGLFESRYPGIAMQAVVGTLGVFAGMLIVYKTRVLRITPKFTRWVFGAVVGVLVLGLVNVGALLLFDTDLGFHDGGTLPLILTVVFIAIAALSLLLSFRAADQMLQMGVSEKWAWYLTFGLIGTMVWLYLDILWVLSPFRLTP